MSSVIPHRPNGAISPPSHTRQRRSADQVGGSKGPITLQRSQPDRQACRPLCVYQDLLARCFASLPLFALAALCIHLRLYSATHYKETSSIPACDIITLGKEHLTPRVSPWVFPRLARNVALPTPWSVPASHCPVSPCPGGPRFQPCSRTIDDGEAGEGAEGGWNVSGGI